MKSSKITLVILLVALSVALNAGNSITIAGSTTVLPIAQSTAEVFMNNNPDVNISIRGGGSSVGIASLISGAVDIGNASRHAKNKEYKIAREKGVNLKENVVANDGIAVITNKATQVSNLTKQQISDIYTGKIKNWKEVGGRNEAIVVIDREASSGTYEVFHEIALDGQAAIEGAMRIQSNNAVVTTVSNTPGAIGYCGLGYVSSKVHPVKVDNVPATIKTVQDRSYPISRTLHMYTNGNPKGVAKEYLDFILSDKGQDLVAEQGFIKVK